MWFVTYNYITYHNWVILFHLDIEVEKRENYRLGVYWLIKSSEQGNTEATELLKTCLSNGKGITEQNYMHVKSCINMTQDEMLARKAARQMFAKLVLLYVAIITYLYIFFI